MEKKVKLTVLGFSFNQTQSGTYGLVLAESEGLRRLMVIIGTPEAQSIAFILHDSQPPRPLTHDLLVTMMTEFDITLHEVIIYKYDNGIFFSRLLMKDRSGENVIIESRTSDAIAISLRTNSPIYTTENIMRELGIVVAENESEEIQENPDTIITEEKRKTDYSSFTVQELEAMMRDAIEGEDYELASILRDEINRR